MLGRANLNSAGHHGQKRNQEIWEEWGSQEAGTDQWRLTQSPRPQLVTKGLLQPRSHVHPVVQEVSAVPEEQLVDSAADSSI